ncbi:glycerophosphoryl diester phosphodiesterase membrane domain-containing protein [Streptomyces sp. NPDC060194]|uniref:glycerophosphoryl diester phosphodiesterase membrane domain-containing protein n=1 Tax=Streptomyces sp. NPDC060194 TaxID=3347069 RepID=UPI00364B21FD
MNDTPGWASPGSAPSDRTPDDASRPAEPDASAAPQEAPQEAPQDTAAGWSKEQPPAGQWSAPGRPADSSGPPQNTGWGGQPPWGGRQGWGGPPPAAKPGVIPLRPLGVGEILDGAVSTLRTHWRTVLGISLAVAVFMQLGITLIHGFLLDPSGLDALQDPGSGQSADELQAALNYSLSSNAVTTVFTLIGTILATALLTMVTSRAVLGRSVTTGEAWGDARPQLLRLTGLTLLLMLMVAGVMLLGMAPGLVLVAIGVEVAGLALLVIGALGGVVAAIWLYYRFSLASPALMLEKQTVRKALGRSAKLVKGTWWRVFGIQLLAFVITFVVAAIILVPATLLAGIAGGSGAGSLLEASPADNSWTFLIITGIGSVISSAITLPIAAGVTVLLYIDLRIRREALDLDLTRAAASRASGDGTASGLGN